MSDLRTDNSRSLAIEAQSWTVVGLLNSSFINECPRGYAIFGGVTVLASGGYYEKTFTSLPPHNMIYFRMKLTIIDDWQSNDTVIAQIDGQNLTAGNIAASRSLFNRDSCGDPSIYDYSGVYFMGKAKHSTANVTFRVISAVSESPSVASFGFREFLLSFINTNTAEPTMSCVAGLTEYMNSNSCGCWAGKFLNESSNKCQSCDVSCSECFGPSSSQCYACDFVNGYSYNGTHCSLCAKGCTDCFGPGPNQCLACSDSYWHGWNYNCSLNCTAPTTAQQKIGDIKLCKLAMCTAGQFYLYNSTCSSSCKSPLVQRNNTFGLFCDLPCPNGSYLYWNGTCITTCYSPLQKNTLSGVNKCSLPCNSEEYMYSDGSCNTKCDLIQTLDPYFGIKMCANFCNDSSLYYYPDTKECALACNSSYHEVKTPYKQCIKNSKASQDKIVYPSQIATFVLKVGATSVHIGSIVSFLLGGPNAGVINLNGFLKMLSYMRYLEINYPERLLIMLNSVNTTFLSLSFGPQIPPALKNEFVKYRLPEKFDDYGFHSSFIVNYWPVITSLLLVLALSAVLISLVYLTKKKPDICRFFYQLSLIIKWNFFLMIFCTNLDGVVIGTSLEFRTFSPTSFAAICSFFIGLIVHIFVLVNFWLIIYIVQDLKKNHQQRLPSCSSSGSKDTKWLTLQLYYKGYKTATFAQRAFMFPYLARLYIFYSILGYLFAHPVTQMALIIAMNTSFLIYMLTKKPFVSKLVQWQCVTDECFMLIINCLIFGLALLDYQERIDLALRGRLGDAIILLNIILNLLDNIFLIGYLYNAIKGAIIAIKVHKAKGLLELVLVFLSPFEAGGMDLDTVTALSQKGSTSANISANIRTNKLKNKSSLIHSSTFSELSLNWEKGSQSKLSPLSNDPNYPRSSNASSSKFYRERIGFISPLASLRTPINNNLSPSGRGSTDDKFREMSSFDASPMTLQYRRTLFQDDATQRLSKNHIDLAPGLVTNGLEVKQEANVDKRLSYLRRHIRRNFASISKVSPFNPGVRSFSRTNFIQEN